MRFNLFPALAACALVVSSNLEAQKIDVLFTTDVHGSIFDYDFVQDVEASNSMSKVASFVQAVRDTSANVLLFDNGDFMQGTPAVYYYNYVDSGGVNIAARVFNYLKYDVVNMGNHDVETGHAVYDKVIRQIEAPVLGANAVRNDNGEPYFKPYTVVERAGKRIAVIGLITPRIPHWLPEAFWSGMHFEDMVVSAKKWIPIVKEKEHPDAIIGLFHAGFDYNYGSQNVNTVCNENASVLVGEQVEGFDALLIGHDHSVFNSNITTPSGRRIPVLDAGTAAKNIGHLEMIFAADGSVNCKARLISTTNLPTNEEFNKNFMPQMLATKAYCKKVVGKMDHAVEAYEALMGSSAFNDVVHRCMLSHSGADISMTAPMLLNTTIPDGEMKVGRLFSLYRFENTLVVMNLTGAEVKKYLEYSYDGWIQNPEKSSHVLNFARVGKLKVNHYNLDSAAGIIYTVDVTKPEGERVNIVSMADGTPFEMEHMYKVALNSYRANGGGNHLQRGAGLSNEEMHSRIVKVIPQDLRGMLIEDFVKEAELGHKLDLQPLNNWKFVPEKLVKKYIRKDAEFFRKK